MTDMDEERIKSLIKWWEETDTQGMDVTRYLFAPLMEAFGDDIDEILEYFNSMDVDDLDTISGCFEDIYEKFMTDEVYDALGKLKEKIEKESMRTKAFREREGIEVDDTNFGK